MLVMENYYMLHHHMSSTAYMDVVDSGDGHKCLLIVVTCYGAVLEMLWQLKCRVFLLVFFKNKKHVCSARHVMGQHIIIFRYQH